MRIHQPKSGVLPRQHRRALPKIWQLSADQHAYPPGFDDWMEESSETVCPRYLRQPLIEPLLRALAGANLVCGSRVMSEHAADPKRLQAIMGALAPLRPDLKVTHSLKELETLGRSGRTTDIVHMSLADMSSLPAILLRWPSLGSLAASPRVLIDLSEERNASEWLNLAFAIRALMAVRAFAGRRGGLTFIGTVDKSLERGRRPPDRLESCRRNGNNPIDMCGFEVLN